LLTGDLTLGKHVIERHLNKDFREGKWQEAANWWIQGGQVSWKQLYGDFQPQRISLPTYPFERISFWAKKENLNTINKSEINNLLPAESLTSPPFETNQMFSLSQSKQN